MSGEPARSAATIERYTGDLDALLDLFQMAMGLESADGARHLIAVERARGTAYYVARADDRIVGLIGVWFDPTGATTELEPPQIIDIAVAPEFRRGGIGRALMDEAVRATRAASYDRLWLYTNGHSPALLTFYRRLGFRLVAVVPDWFGDGSAKAIFRRDLLDE
jgi:ribosomal protein S18 acetylase RimI-like enzyme